MIQNNLPMIAGNLNEKMLQSFLLPEKERKVSLDMAYMQTLAISNPDLQVADFLSFVQLAQLTGADPRKRQIYLTTKRKKITTYANGQKQENWITTGVPIFAYQFFIAKGQATGELSDGPHVEYGTASYFNPATGQSMQSTLWARARASRNGKEMSFVAWWPEFCQYTSEGNVNQMWTKMPYVMLGKCAIANVMRLLFTAELSGMYVAEEITGEESLPPIDLINLVPPIKTAEPVSSKSVEPEVMPKEDEKPEPENDANEDVIDAEVEKPTENPSVEPTVTNEPIVSKYTRQVLWGKIQKAAVDRKVNLQQAIQMLQATQLTESLAQSLMVKIDAGDFTFFHGTGGVQ